MLSRKLVNALLCMTNKLCQMENFWVKIAKQITSVCWPVTYVKMLLIIAQIVACSSIEEIHSSNGLYFNQVKATVALIEK